MALGSSGMRVVRVRFTNFAQIGLSRITSALTAWGSWGGGGSKLLRSFQRINPLNPELNPICYLLALLGAHHFLHVSRIRVNSARIVFSYDFLYKLSDKSRVLGK